MLIAGYQPLPGYIPNKTQQFEVYMPLLLVLPVSSFPFCNSTYLSTYLHLPVCKSCEPIPARIPSIACLLETFLPASEFSKTESYRFRSNVRVRPLHPPPFVFRISNSRVGYSWSFEGKNASLYEWNYQGCYVYKRRGNKIARLG